MKGQKRGLLICVLSGLFPAVKIPVFDLFQWSH
jgi:hypothetical protein